MPKSSNVVPIRPAVQSPVAPTPEQKLKLELEDRLFYEKHYTYQRPRRASRLRKQAPPDLTKEAIKAWRRATLLTWMMMWGWWR